ncbi:MAG TPA: hypothetical protein V6D08_20275 [Candidatus Obscuribacterales bacterium]
MQPVVVLAACCCDSSKQFVPELTRAIYFSQWFVTALDLAEEANLVAFHGMNGGVAVFKAIYVQASGAQIHLVPAEVDELDELAGAQGVAVHHGYVQPVAQAVAAGGAGGFLEAADLSRGQVLRERTSSLRGLGGGPKALLSDFAENGVWRLRGGIWRIPGLQGPGDHNIADKGHFRQNGRGYSKRSACVPARAKTTTSGLPLSIVYKQEVPADVAFTVSAPLALQLMVLPLRPEWCVVCNQQQHSFFQAIHIVSSRV